VTTRAFRIQNKGARKEMRVRKKRRIERGFFDYRYKIKADRGEKLSNIE
jgi:hypothetical protein